MVTFAQAAAFLSPIWGRKLRWLWLIRVRVPWQGVPRLGSMPGCHFPNQLNLIKSIYVLVWDCRMQCIQSTHSLMYPFMAVSIMPPLHLVSHAGLPASTSCPTESFTNRSAGSTGTGTTRGQILWQVDGLIMCPPHAWNPPWAMTQLFLPLRGRITARKWSADPLPRGQKFWAMGSSQVAIWWFRERVPKSDFRVHDWLDITVVCRSFGNRFAIGTARMLFLKAACNGYQSFVFSGFQRSRARPKHVFHGFVWWLAGFQVLRCAKVCLAWGNFFSLFWIVSKSNVSAFFWLRFRVARALFLCFFFVFIFI